MEKDAVIKIREYFKKAIYHLYHRSTGEKAKFAPIIHIVLDNSVNIYAMEADPDNPENDTSSVVWDDDNELLFWFRHNTPSSVPNSPSNSMSMGVKSDFPAEVIGSNYEQIQNMRIIMNEEAFTNFTNELKKDGLMTDKQIDNIYRNIFEETDMNVVISRKREVNYNTGLLKKYDKETNEDSAYLFAVHGAQSGGV